MADLTHGAVDSLLGVLSEAIKDEAQLLSGVQGDIQFIKDEMDSMNGFLLHLTKTESPHDDQVRAWMKQVREVAYISEDLIDRYLHDIQPFEGDGGCRATFWLFLCHNDKYRLRRRLAKQIYELKVRVHDVGERRQRYDVTVPEAGSDVNLLPAGGQEEEGRRKDFVRDVEAFLVAWRARPQLPAAAAAPPSDTTAPPILGQDAIGKQLPAAAAAAPPPPSDTTAPQIRGQDAIGKQLPAAAAAPPPPSDTTVPPILPDVIRKQLPGHVQSEAATVVGGILKKCSPDVETASRCIKMLLCALYVYPYATTNLELKKLVSKRLLEEGRAEELKEQVMVFCYSMLSTPQKSCLQYLTAFLEESEISRTSLVRRWVAEGLVGKLEQGSTTPEEAGERYFRELVFRGFIRPSRIGDAGTVKSCVLDGSIRYFITRIAGSENFLADLPAHLDRQLKIRKIVKRPRPLPHQAAKDLRWVCWRNISRRNLGCCDWRRRGAAVGEDQDPMDELADFLKGLPGLYRLNVLDLGGCKGLKQRHMETICSVVWLKYLSLRKTDVSRLPPQHLKKLTLLETLDIRGTNILPGDVKKMYLPKLKHLLAGSYEDKVTGADVGTARTSAEVSLVTVPMPVGIGAMRRMETLSHVQVSDNGTELERLVKLQQLRKLGVVVRRANDRTAENLRHVIYKLAGCLRSLSIWVTQGGVLDISILPEATSSLILENLDIKGRSILPFWIEKAGKLANISLRDTEMNNAGDSILRRLGNVLSLSCLKLNRRAFIEQALFFRDVEFKALRFLVVEGDDITRIDFSAGTAPKLEKIVWAISKVHEGRDLIFGIDHLPNLQVIELRGDFNFTKLLQATAAHTNPSRYLCRYVYYSSSESSHGKVITELSKTGTDGATLSLPVDVIN